MIINQREYQDALTALTSTISMLKSSGIGNTEIEFALHSLSEKPQSHYDCARELEEEFMSLKKPIYGIMESPFAKRPSQFMLQETKDITK